jgi:flavin reductase (DIM6/NTAB) family NADH-FMN oxidoreductase RutF
VATTQPDTNRYDEIRDVLASFPAGVVVVTAMAPDGSPRGLTVSAFCSVSAEPPLVLVCVDKTSNTLPAIQHSGAFTVNILAGGREEVARNFASKRDNKFAAVAWRPWQDAAPAGPILHEDVAAFLVCVVERVVEAGDHWVFIGEVVEVERADESRLLLYHRRSFSSVGDAHAATAD